MIRVAPDTSAGQVLGALVALGGATAAEVGAHLWPYPRVQPRPLPRDEWALALAVADTNARPHLAAAHAEDMASRAAEILGRLARMRLVSALDGYTLPRWVMRSLPTYYDAAHRMQADPTRAGLPPVDGLLLLCCRALEVDAWAEGAPYATPEPQALARVVREVRVCPTLRTSEHGGSWRATLARAVRLGLLEQAGRREATDEGRALVGSWGAP